MMIGLSTPTIVWPEHAVVQASDPCSKKGNRSQPKFVIRAGARGDGVDAHVVVSETVVICERADVIVPIVSVLITRSGIDQQHSFQQTKGDVQICPLTNRRG